MDHKPVLRRPSANQKVRSSNLSRHANYQEPSTAAIELKRPVGNDRYSSTEMANDGFIWLSAPIDTNLPAYCVLTIMLLVRIVEAIYEY